MAKRVVDIEYACHDGFWTRFYPNTPAGDKAYNVMAKADPNGVVAFMPNQVPSVLYQLRKAGLTVGKAKKAKPVSDDELDAFLAELDPDVNAFGMSPACKASGNLEDGR